jgi:hypothetical protein
MRKINTLTLIAKHNTLSSRKLATITKKFMILLFIVKVKSKLTKKIIVAKKKLAIVIKLKS